VNSGHSWPITFKLNWLVAIAPSSGSFQRRKTMSSHPLLQQQPALYCIFPATEYSAPHHIQDPNKKKGKKILKLYLFLMHYSCPGLHNFCFQTRIFKANPIVNRIIPSKMKMIYSSYCYSKPVWLIFFHWNKSCFYSNQRYAAL